MYEITQCDIDYVIKYAGAMKKVYRECDYEELKSAALEGMCKALPTFRPDKFPGVKFRHYAYLSMRQTLFSVVKNRYEIISREVELIDVVDERSNRRCLIDYNTLRQDEVDMIDELINSNSSKANVARMNSINVDTYYSRIRRITNKLKKNQKNLT